MDVLVVLPDRHCYTSLCPTQVFASLHALQCGLASQLWGGMKLRMVPTMKMLFSSKSSASLMLVKKLSRYTWFLSGEDGSHFVGEFEIFHVYARTCVCAYACTYVCAYACTVQYVL